MAQITRSTLYTLRRPSQCYRRLRLIEGGIPHAAPGPLEEIVIDLGLRHEARYIDALPDVVHLKDVPREQREARTLEELRGGTRILAHGLLRSRMTVGGEQVQLVGEPDLLIPIPSPKGWIIRDVKLTRRLEDHPEIADQMNLYGALIERVTGAPPAALEVVLGDGTISGVEYVGHAGVQASIAAILDALRQHDAYEPIGWSKCHGCGYFDRCWKEAEERNEVALLPDVDQGLARQLHGRGIATIADLVARMSVEELHDLKRPWGETKIQRVGKRAGPILVEAQCFLDGIPRLLGDAELPAGSAFLVLDLEGIPPFLDGPEEIFLWGMKVYGNAPSEYTASYTMPGETDDQATWFGFLEKAESLFAAHGDLPILHWASYEGVKLRLYRKRYGDPNGTAARIERCLCDLLTVYSKGICVPLPSRSLKVVEKYVGYERTLPGSGDWAVANYIRAVSAEDREEAHRLVGEVLKYNEEDLDATWAVFQWMRKLMSETPASGASRD